MVFGEYRRGPLGLVLPFALLLWGTGDRGLAQQGAVLRAVGDGGLTQQGAVL